MDRSVPSAEVVKAIRSLTEVTEDRSDQGPKWTPTVSRVGRVRVTLTVTVRVSRVSVMVSVRDSVK